ncbi:metallophosphoesterase [candidate division KSB1 bacterium]|nr:metallophosphoesterase [candidate division KSB1 bacterium]
MAKKSINRREFLTNTATAAFGTTALVSLATVSCAPAAPQRRRVLRLAHLTDIHVQPELNAAAGMARALQHAQNLQDKPEIIFNGGDAIMDALGADKARTQTQWQLWQSVLQNECSLPIVHCIGNHDVWGWKAKNPAISSEQLYGKQWAMQEFGLSSRYYGFDRAGWHFIVLDSTHFLPGGYIAKLDDEQFEWLQDDLNRTPGTTPICVLSHIPIMCFCAFFDGENEASGDWKIPGAWMHIDARRIKDVFKQHSNIKLCLSGHIHLQDEVEYLGVKYLCNGAVSGNWWEGAYQEFPPAYVVVDLFDDGSSASEYIPY